MSARRYPGLPALLLCAACLPASAQVSVSLRAAEQPSPSKTPWDNGASIAYTSIDGNSTTDIDAVLTLDYVAYQPLSARQDGRVVPGSVAWTASAGPYLHKHRDSTKPSNDRGATASIGANWVPPSNGSGPVRSFNGGLTVEGGRTLTLDRATGQYVDVDTRRYILSGTAFYDPHPRGFLRATVGAYSDKAYGAPVGGPNGRENGVLAGLEVSLYPLGRDYRFPDVANGLIPLLVFRAQKQWDTSASGGREERDYRLASATLKFLFAPHDSAFVPSLDISRSFGDDLLNGRERSGMTSVRFSVKY